MKKAKDISFILEKAILLSDDYNSKTIAHKIEKLPNTWCRLEDDSNLSWYLISKSNGKSVLEYYGYLSVKFPIALLMENCTDNIYNLLAQNEILLEKYYEKYTCKETILKQYTKNKIFIDDRFLYDETIPFDEKIFLKIDEGIEYINPFCFTFDEIK